MEQLLSPLEILIEAYFCPFFGDFSSPKVDAICNSYWVTKYQAYSCHKFGDSFITKVDATGNIYWVTKYKAYNCHKFSDFFSTKVDATCNSYYANQHVWGPLHLNFFRKKHLPTHFMKVKTCRLQVLFTTYTFIRQIRVCDHTFH